MSDENLKFVIKLSGTYWDKKPQYSVWLDDKVIVQSEVNHSESLINFERNVAEGEHVLKIRLENKEDTDTVIENGKIVKDMLLNIDDIEIDDISLGNILWDSEFIADELHDYNGTQTKHLTNCVNLGWKGTYILKFTSPFYIWLLEKL